MRLSNFFGNFHIFQVVEHIIDSFERLQYKNETFLDRFQFKEQSVY
jgi:hypothetical protein